MSSDFELDPLEVMASGQIIVEIAGENLTNRQLVRYNASGQMVTADASAVATLPCIGITLAAATSGQRVEVLLRGYVGLSTWTWTAGQRLYVGDVAGSIVAVAGTITQEVGIARSATQIWFHPQGLDTGGTALIYARERPAALQGPRNVLNFVEGANITLTVADNVPNAEIDITIAATGGVATREFFYGAPNIDAAVGDHGGQTMADGIGTYIRRDMLIPHDFTTLTRCDIIVVQSTAANPNMVWTCNTDWGAICAGEDYLEDSDNTGATSALLQDDLVCLEISAALTGIVAGDLVGVSFYRDGANGADTVGGNVYYLGIRLRYT